MGPYSQFLSHHDLEVQHDHVLDLSVLFCTHWALSEMFAIDHQILPNENVLMLCWERKSREEAIKFVLGS